MSGALASFCILAVGARELSAELSIAQTLCIRSAIGLLFLSLIYLINKVVFRRVLTKKTEVNNLSSTLNNKRVDSYVLGGFSLQVFRNIFHFTAQYGWFFGIGLLPLAEVFALEFTVPIWTLLIAVLFLDEKVTPTKSIAIILGTLGVLVIVQPGQAVINSASFVVLGSAIFFAVTYTLTKLLSATYSPFSILLYMCAIQFPIGLVLSFNNWLWPDYIQWLWLIVIGLSALSAHFFITKAMQFAEVTTVVTLDFLRLPLITLVGVLLYAESFELSLIFGGVLMLLGNVLNAGKLKFYIDQKYHSFFSAKPN
jgi:drug/metabolite transporter (DMT)-like permease